MTYYGLRTCKVDMTSYNNFKWPKRGEVTAPDWDPSPCCGNGLHAFLNGEGSGVLAGWGVNEKWLVVSFEEYVDLGGKVKFPKAKVLYAGSRELAVKKLKAKIGNGYAVIGDTATAGDHGTAAAGDHGTAAAGDHGTARVGFRGTATAGDKGTAAAGDRGTAAAGDRGTAAAGDHGTARAGNHGTARVGFRGTATAGDRGTATAGPQGTATAGDRGTATAGTQGTAKAGSYGTAKAGRYGTATAGDGGTAAAGRGGIIQLSYSDGRRTRVKTGYIGWDGFKAGVAYKLDSNHEFVVASNHK